MFYLRLYLCFYIKTVIGISLLKMIVLQKNYIIIYNIIIIVLSITTLILLNIVPNIL